jgi:hypothetical protein
MPKTYFECVLCGDEKFEELPRWVDDNCRICDECAGECVTPRFHNALEHEHHYPPTWGNVVLDIWTFWDLFDADFLTAWRKKLQEYSVPVKFRLYCEHRSGIGGVVCGAYLGTKGPGSVCCAQCSCFTYRKCEVGSSDISRAKTHRCREVSKEDPFEKLTKGKDYQQCPGCKKEIFQAEGCNHMTCIAPCDTHFCFFCGQQVVARRSGHWMQGYCPRFGVAGKTLIWDEEGEHSEADSEADGDDDGDEFDGDPAYVTDEESGSDDEAPSLASNSAERIEVDRLIGIFDHARDAEQHEDTRNRSMMAPTMTHRESRARFYSYISHNLALVNQVRQVRFDLDDAVDILVEFSNRHRHINRRLLLYRSGTEMGVWQGSRVTELEDIEDELDSYMFYADETIEALQHIVAGDTVRVAREDME